MRQPSELENSFLLEQFHGFYSEVIRQKEIARKQARGAASPQPREDSPESGKHPIFIRLSQLLEQQAVESRQRGGEYGAGIFHDAQFVMAALADEVFLNLDWPGKTSWEKHLLEAAFFGTQSSGEIFFDRLDVFLTENDSGRTELAAVYFMALSLGFLGKFRDQKEGRSQLDHYRKQLYLLIFNRSPGWLSEQRQLFSEPYAYTLSQESGKKLPPIRRWIWAIGIVALLFLTASQMVWTHVTRDLSQTANQIISESGK